jgi:hypothetical protein
VARRSAQAAIPGSLSHVLGGALPAGFGRPAAFDKQSVRFFRHFPISQSVCAAAFPPLDRDVFMHDGPAITLRRYEVVPFTEPKSV